MRTRDAVGGRLKLKQLRLIVSIDEQASVLRAADTLNISQPGATKLLKDAERDLGVPLFDRTNRGMVATAYGRALIRHAKLVLTQLYHAAEELDDLTEGTGGRVTVGTLLAASANLLPTAIRRLREKRPRVSVAVIEGTNDRLMPALAVGDIDFVVGRLPEFRFRDEFVQEPLFHEDVCVVVRAGHPLARRKRLEISALVDGDWILPPPETTLRRQVEKAFHDAGIEAPRPAVQSVSLLTNRALLLTTNMMVVWPRQVVLDDVRRGVLAILPVALPAAAGPVGLSRRRNVILSPAAQALAAELKAPARDLNLSARGHDIAERRHGLRRVRLMPTRDAIRGFEP
jgi:DNA-binding transcriptional LysR family regulator